MLEKAIQAIQERAEIDELECAFDDVNMTAPNSINYQEPNNGNTLLHYAVLFENEEAQALLINKYKAKTTIKNKQGKSVDDLLAPSSLNTLRYDLVTFKKSHEKSIDDKLKIAIENISKSDSLADYMNIYIALSNCQKDNEKSQSSYVQAAKKIFNQHDEFLIEQIRDLFKKQADLLIEHADLKNPELKKFLMKLLDRAKTPSEEVVPTTFRSEMKKPLFQELQNLKNSNIDTILKYISCIRLYRENIVTIAANEYLEEKPQPQRSASPLVVTPPTEQHQIGRHNLKFSNIHGIYKLELSVANCGDDFIQWMLKKSEQQDQNRTIMLLAEGKHLIFFTRQEAANGFLDCTRTKLADDAAAQPAPSSHHAQ